MFEHLFPLGRGEGGRGGNAASFNQDLKTGEPLIKSGLRTFILFLWRLCWLVSAALILCSWSVVSDLSLLPITRWSSCDVEKETPKNPWPRLPLLTATSKWACVWYVVPPVFFCVCFFPPPCSETVPLIFRVLSQTSPPGYRGAVTGRCPTTCMDGLYLTWIRSWWWGQTLRQASWQMSCLSALVQCW